MATQTAVLRLCLQNLPFKKLSIRSLSSQAAPPKSPKKSKPSKEAPAAASPSQTGTTLAYVSAATPKPPAEPVGPGASKMTDYKNPEYFCYNQLSFYDLEVEMVKDRLPQPKSGNELL